MSTRESQGAADRKTNYRGYELHAYIDEAMGGWEEVYWSIFRKSDLFEAASGFGGSTNLDEVISGLQSRVDEELASPDPWGEQADQ